jgi:hypothetical protein
MALRSVGAFPKLHPDSNMVHHQQWMRGKQKRQRKTHQHC